MLATAGSSSSARHSSVIADMSAETITTSTIAPCATGGCCEACAPAAASGAAPGAAGCSLSASMAESLPTRSDREAPLLSVAVLSYDGRHLLEVILPSLARQRFRDFEVIVVDNGSRDDSIAWLRRAWPQVEIVSLPENVGVTAALNVCARAGRGELVGLFHNDLELEPEGLGELR